MKKARELVKRLVVAQGQKYEAPIKNQTNEQWSANLSCKTLHHVRYPIQMQDHSFLFGHDFLD